jgi:hypothetical protein
MQELINPIQDNLEELYKKLDKQLSLQHVGFNISYKNSHYFFEPPTTPTEHKQQLKSKKAFIKRLLKDTLKKAIDTIVDETDYYPWHAIISFDDKYITTWEKLNPGETTESYVVDTLSTTEVKSKDLDYESQYIFSQRQDLTPEMWQDFFGDKFGKTFDSEPQHATIAGENSNS